MVEKSREAGGSPAAGSLPGPHLCSHVGAQVSGVLRAAMLEMCDRHGGRISGAEIDHVFDLVANSTELFSLFQRAYSNCVGLKSSPHFTDVDEDVVTRFVIGAYCRDVVAKVFKTQIREHGRQWTHAFIDGLTAFIVKDIDPELPQDLFRAYRKLAMTFGGTLTPVTILHSDDIVMPFSRAVSRLQSEVSRDAKTLQRLEAATNVAIARALNLSGPSPEKLNNVTGMALVMGLSRRSERNPFRTLVLDSAKAA